MLPLCLWTLYGFWAAFRSLDQNSGLYRASFSRATVHTRGGFCPVLLPCYATPITQIPDPKRRSLHFTPSRALSQDFWGSDSWIHSIANTSFLQNELPLCPTQLTHRHWNSAASTNHDPTIRHSCCRLMGFAPIHDPKKDFRIKPERPLIRRIRGRLLSARSCACAQTQSAHRLSCLAASTCSARRSAGVRGAVQHLGVVVDLVAICSMIATEAVESLLAFGPVGSISKHSGT